MSRRTTRIILTAATLAAGTLTFPFATMAQAAPARSMIRTVDFRNEPWDFGDGTIADVRDGSWSEGSVDAGDFRSLEILDVDHGDLDGDGTEEAIVTTNENTGGTGQFTDAVVFRWTGKGPVRVTSHGVGDRSDDGIYNVVIVGGVGRIERFTDGEGACCPTEVSTFSVKLRGSNLVTARPTTKRAYVVLANAPEEPTVISFLRGTSSATIEGAEGSRGTIDARKGQVVTVAVAKSRFSIASRPVTLSKGSTVLLKVSGGGIGKVTLPSTGRFTLAVPVAGDAGYSSAELAIR